MSKSQSFTDITFDLIQEFEHAQKTILKQERIYKDATELLRLSAEISKLRRILRLISSN
ncbi:MAG: hypothetical protein ACXACU_01895 [Candidatus Hodarchaeales archaeon]|jgi:hypothetical protein